MKSRSGALAASMQTDVAPGESFSRPAFDTANPTRECARLSMEVLPVNDCHFADSRTCQLLCLARLSGMKLGMKNSEQVNRQWHSEIGNQKGRFAGASGVSCSYRAG